MDGRFTDEQLVQGVAPSSDNRHQAEAGETDDIPVTMRTVKADGNASQQLWAHHSSWGAWTQARSQRGARQVARPAQPHDQASRLIPTASKNSQKLTGLSTLVQMSTALSLCDYRSTRLVLLCLLHMDQFAPDTLSCL